ncbi:MAG: CHAD domain-containing protein [Fidelibacterota bacterium]
MHRLRTDRLLSGIESSLDAMHEDIGILAAPDYQEETLHHYRVNGRRMTTITDLCYRLTMDQGFKKARRQSRALVVPTRNLRDLDVALASLRNFPRHDWTDSFSLTLQQRKQKAFTLFETNLVKSWHQQYDRLKRFVSEFRNRDIIPVYSLATIMENRKNKMQMKKEHAQRYPVQETLHKLRLAVKRLRYSLDTGFPGEYPETINALKLIQDDLGRAHDADVQMDLALKTLADQNHVLHNLQTLRSILNHYEIRESAGLDLMLKEIPEDAGRYLKFLYRERMNHYLSFRHNWEVNNHELSIIFT